MLSKSQTEALIKEALTAQSWDQVSRFMKDKFGTQGDAGAYAQALADNSDLLDRLLPEQVQSLLRFVAGFALKQYPELTRHLNIEQKEKLLQGQGKENVKSSMLNKVLAGTRYPTLEKVLAGTTLKYKAKGEDEKEPSKEFLADSEDSAREKHAKDLGREEGADNDDIEVERADAPKKEEGSKKKSEASGVSLEKEAFKNDFNGKVAAFASKLPKLFKAIMKSDMADRFQGGINDFYFMTTSDGKKCWFIEEPGHGWYFDEAGKCIGEEDGGFDDPEWTKYNAELPEMHKTKGPK